MKISLDLYDAQDDFVYDQTRFTAFIGGIGSGKTFAGCTKALLQCKKPGLGLVVAPTYKMLKDATIRTFRDVAGPMWRGMNKSEMLAQIGNAEVLFRSSDKPERLRGPNLSWAYVDEAALSDERTWQILIGRLRADRQAGPGWITTTPKGRNWVWREFVEQQRPEYAVHRARTDENPYLADEYIDDLKAAYTGSFARQELAGEFVAFEGLVYDEFRREFHIAERDDKWDRVYAGVDWGYTNPATILVLGFDSDDRAHLIDEWYERRQLIGGIVSAAKRLQQKHDIERFFCDPSEPANLEEMYMAGLDAEPAENAVNEGLQRVKARLAVAGDGRPRLTVEPHCVNTIAEFESYCWKENREGEYKDEPEKANDHAMDALRYCVMGAELSAGPWAVLI